MLSKLAITALLCTLIPLFSCLPGTLGSSGAAKSKAQEYFSQSSIECGGRTFVSKGVMGWYEVRGLSFSAKESDLTDADRANGVDWNGTVHVSCNIARIYLPGEKRWSEWQKEMLLFNPQGVIEVISVRKRHGKWEAGPFAAFLAIPPNQGRKISCDQVPQ